jgi:hypothetical protein
MECSLHIDPGAGGKGVATLGFDVGFGGYHGIVEMLKVKIEGGDNKMET